MFYDATRKTRTTSKISTFFKNLSFLNPWSHLHTFDNTLSVAFYTVRIQGKNALKVTVLRTVFY